MTKEERQRFKEIRKMADMMPIITTANGRSRIFHFRKDIDVINKTNMNKFGFYPVTKRSLKEICKVLEDGKIVTLTQLDKYGQPLDRILEVGSYVIRSGALTELNYLIALLDIYGDKLQYYQINKYEFAYELKKG